MLSHETVNERWPSPDSEVLLLGACVCTFSCLMFSHMQIETAGSNAHLLERQGRAKTQWQDVLRKFIGSDGGNLSSEIVGACGAGQA
jgi:hypothetical protein